MQLYFSPNSCSLAPMIALEEAAADYDPVRIDFAAKAQRSPDYLKINPKGRVPALVTERGILTEVPAILAFIARSFPAARLAPADPFDFAKCQEFNAYLAATVHVAHAHKGRGERWSDDPTALQAMKAKVPQNMRDCFALIESRMAQGPWVSGQAFTICDPYLFTIAGWLGGDGVDIAEFPAVAAHHRAMQKRPAVIRALSRQSQ